MPMAVDAQATEINTINYFLFTVHPKDVQLTQG
jgi:hypothetical protein